MQRKIRASSVFACRASSLLLLLWHFHSQMLHGELQIFPCFALLPWIAQQVRRVIRCDERRSAEIMDVSTQAGHGFIHFEQCFCGGRAKSDDHLWGNDLDLLEEER